MARLSILAALLAPALALAVPTAARADNVARWGAEIDAAAIRCGVPALWIARVMRAESGGQTMLDGRPIVSRAGAMGLMQLMPATWAQMRGTLSLGSDPHNPADNIVAGACYLRLMYDRFGYPGLFGAYNAGPGRYAAWLAGRSQLPGETRAYLVSVAGQGSAGPVPAAITTPRAAPPIFIALRTVATAPVADSGTGPRDTRGALFVIER